MLVVNDDDVETIDGRPTTGLFFDELAERWLRAMLVGSSLRSWAKCSNTQDPHWASELVVSRRYLTPTMSC